MNHNHHQYRSEHSSRIPNNMSFQHYVRQPEYFGQNYMAWPNNAGYRPAPTITSHFHRHHQQQLYHTPEYVAAKHLHEEIFEYHWQYLFDVDGIHETLAEKLESMIEKYLTLVPQQDKFLTSSISECLRYNILRKSFNPSKAILAFSAIEKYATNLLSYPWREEFKKIYAYNGFFFKTIDSVLQNYDPVLRSIGFSHQNNDCIFVLDENLFEVRKVKELALDCLIAKIFLRQIIQIYESLHHKCSYKEIFRIFDQNICDTQDVIQILSSTISDNSLSSSSSSNHRRLIDLDSPDYSMKRPSRLPLREPSPSPPTDHIIPPPNGYLESDLDKFEFIDKSPNTTNTQPMVVKSSTSYPQLPKASSKNDSKTKFNLDDRIQQEFEQLDINKHDLNYKPKNVKNEKKIPMNQYRNESYHHQQYHSSGQQSSPSSSSSPSKYGRKMSKSKESWTCKSCSSYNDLSVTVCSVCAKSRHPGAEATPLEPGGKACPSCTMINTKDAEVCLCCQCSLEHAGTYI